MNAPTETAELQRPEPTRTYWWIEVGAAAVVALVYLVMPRRDMSQSGLTGAQSNARTVLHFERALGLYIEDGVQRLSLHLGAGPFHWSYGILHFVVTGGLLVYLYRRRPMEYARWRTIFVVASLLALVIYRWFPLAPPRLFSTEGSPLMLDTLSTYGAPWTFDSGLMSHAANQYAAIPSMHAGWALFCALALGSGRSLRSRVVLLSYPFAVTVIIMGTGNHFFVDAIAGFAVIGIAFVLCRLTASVGSRFGPLPPQG